MHNVQQKQFLFWPNGYFSKKMTRLQNCGSAVRILKKISTMKGAKSYINGLYQWFFLKKSLGQMT